MIDEKENSWDYEPPGWPEGGPPDWEKEDLETKAEFIFARSLVHLAQAHDAPNVISKALQAIAMCVSDLTVGAYLKHRLTTKSHTSKIPDQDLISLLTEISSLYLNGVGIVVAPDGHVTFGEEPAPTGNYVFDTVSKNLFDLNKSKQDIDSVQRLEKYLLTYVDRLSKLSFEESSVEHIGAQKLYDFLIETVKGLITDIRMKADYAKEENPAFSLNNVLAHPYAGAFQAIAGLMFPIPLYVRKSPKGANQWAYNLDNDPLFGMIYTPDVEYLASTNLQAFFEDYQSSNPKPYSYDEGSEPD